MAVATNAFYLAGAPYGGVLGTLINAYGSELVPEGSPAILYGQGTPGAIPPFTLVNKGSLYMELNATNNNPSVWSKVAEAGAAADWVRFGNTGIVTVIGDLIDIDAADSEQVIFHAVTASEVLEAGIMWEQATETTGTGDGDITIGTASGGNQIVTATIYNTASATGTYQALTIAAGALAAGTSVFHSHDDAGTSIPGTYRLLMKIRVEA